MIVINKANKMDRPNSDVSEHFDNFADVMSGFIKLEELAEELPKAKKELEPLPEEFMGATFTLGASRDHQYGIDIIAKIGSENAYPPHYVILNNLISEKRRAIEKIVEEKGYKPLGNTTK